MSENNVIENDNFILYRVQFLSGDKGYGWMEVEKENRTITKIVTDNGDDVTNAPISYTTVGNNV